MTENLKKVWIGLELLPESQIIAQKISNDIATLFRQQKIHFVNSEEFHITLGYFKEISAKKIGEILNFYQQKKYQFQKMPIVNSKSEFDQTFHKMGMRKSNLPELQENEEIYINFLPHNESNIYKPMIKFNPISPHINIAKVKCSEEEADKLLKQCKEIRDHHITTQENEPLKYLAPNLGKILIKV